MDTLDGMKTFVAVAQEGSFTAAGRRLNMSTKLVSKYVGQLEERLDTQLFNRTTRSVKLTDVGSAYLERCRPLLEQFDELEALVHERQRALAGPIRITAPTAFGSTRLVIAVRPFLAQHPRVSLDMKLTDHRVAVVEEGFDLAVRIGQRRDSTLIARRLAPMPLVVCASPEYLREHGRPAHPSALATHRCLIDENLTASSTWRFLVDGDELSVRVSGPVRANAPTAIAAMAVGGIGIALCPQYVVEAHLQAGRLERLFTAHTANHFGVYALYPPNRHLTARVRALIDHLAETFGSGRDHLAETFGSGREHLAETFGSGRGHLAEASGSGRGHLAEASGSDTE